MITKKNPITKGIEPKNITILQLNAPSHMDPTTDRRTGPKIAALKRGEAAFPIHPTPTS